MLAKLKPAGVTNSKPRVNEQEPVFASTVHTTWMMMLMGMAGIGFAMRRKEKQTLRVRYTQYTCYPRPA